MGSEHDNAVWQSNLSAIRRRDPELAERLAATEPAVLDFAPSKAGPLSAAYEQDGQRITLASRYDPVAEARKLVADIDHIKTACVVALGFGLGYHAACLAKDVGARGLLIVYEPNLALLRAVLQHVDHSAWLGADNVILCGPGIDRPALTSKLEKLAALVTQGTQLVTHPASRRLHEEDFRGFAQMVTDTLAFCRTNVATALVNASRTCRNLAHNLDVYTAGATTNELHNAAKGYPAVCVGAGPSLVKNVELLLDPDIRRNVIVISVQTTLKPLLDRGIRPDFVTALDYSPICAQFYESLPPLPDVTLVVEPKANRAILQAYPGPIRVCAADFNDRLLGAELARPRVAMKPGSTVAHLSFYLAQHLGCDPIMFIGQDLGFSDGLYYAPGTAAWRVWSPELNPFNTLEMFEWQRIVRMRGHLRRFEDVNGNPIYSDEQMLTYLKQFERDFATDVAASGGGRTIIDATEGGMPKQHTTRMTLREAIDQHATRPTPKLPIPGRALDLDRLERLNDLLKNRLAEVNDLRQTSEETVRVVKQMRKHQRDPRKMDPLFEKLRKLQRHVHEDLRDTFAIVNMVNTIGTFKRQRADRAIAQAYSHSHSGGGGGGGGGDSYERQQAQMERDLVNLELTIEACDETLDILREARDFAAESLKASVSESMKRRDLSRLPRNSATSRVAS